MMLEEEYISNAADPFVDFDGVIAFFDSGLYEIF